MKKRMFRNKKAFTALELVAVIAVMLILVTMILPILSNIRESGRRAKCLNNLKQLGIGFHMYAAENYGFFPASTWWDSSQGVNPDGTFKIGGAWDYSISPYLMDGDYDNASELYLCPTYVTAHPEYEEATNKIERTYGMSVDWAPGGDLPSNNPASPLVWPHMDSIVRPMNTILLGPVKRTAATTYLGSPVEWNGILADRSNADLDRHNGGANYLFVDGHAGWMSENEAGQWHNG